MSLNRMIIIGAGGHAKVVADIILLLGYDLVGFLDDDSKRWTSYIAGRPVLGGVETLLDYSFDGIVLGIGSNVARKQIADKLPHQISLPWLNVIHPQTVISSSVKFGVGVVIAAGSIVNIDSVIGDHVIINTGATIDHDCRIESYVHIAPGNHLAGNVTVKEGAFIGIGSAIIPQMTIGKWSTVGAGSTVVRDIPDNVIAKGTPARWQLKE